MPCVVSTEADIRTDLNTAIVFLHDKKRYIASKHIIAACSVSKIQ